MIIMTVQEMRRMLGYNAPFQLTNGSVDGTLCIRIFEKGEDA